MKETIVAAAMKYEKEAWDSDDSRALDYVIVSAPPPARHRNLFIAYNKLGPPIESGFLTSKGRFVGREEGLKVAMKSGQPMIDHDARHPTLLFSEDLW